MSDLDSITREMLAEHLTCNTETGKVRWIKPHKRRRLDVDLGTRIKAGYLMIGLPHAVDSRNVYVHRLVWMWHHGRWPVGQIDHINGVKDDNRIANLREVSSMVNAQNRRRVGARTTTGFLGVRLTHGRYNASIKVGDRRIALGSYDTPEEAHIAYVEAKRQWHEGNTL